MTNQLPNLNEASKMPFNKDLPTALYIIRDDGGCGFYRCYQPALALRRHGLFNTITDMKATTPEHIMKADIVIFQESGSLDAIEAMKFAIEQNKAIIVESDDLLNAVSPHNPGYESWNPSTLFWYRTSMQMIRAHALTVTTPQLAREYFPYNSNIYVLPNYLNQDKWTLPVVRKTDNVIRIGWAGGNAHIDDLKMIAPVIEKIIKEYDGRVKFETMGPTKNELGNTFSHLEEFNERCPKCDYQGQSTTWGGETLDNYPTVLASHGWDIALAPVINTAFNNAKSDLKLKEYSAIGVPMIASDVTPYREAKKDGCTVTLADNFKEWYNAIKYLIENPEVRNKIADDNRTWVGKYWIDENIQKYADAYSEVMASAKISK